MVFIITGAFILLDFVTGIIKAFKNKCFTSSVMREGLFHKAGSILIIVLGAMVDYAQGFIDLGAKIPISATICIYICLMEIGSVIENLGEINPRIIPNKIQVYFQKLVAKEDDQEDDVHSKKG